MKNNNWLLGFKLIPYGFKFKQRLIILTLYLGIAITHANSLTIIATYFIMIATAVLLSNISLEEFTGLIGSAPGRKKVALVCQDIIITSCAILSYIFNALIAWHSCRKYADTISIHFTLSTLLSIYGVTFMYILFISLQSRYFWFSVIIYSLGCPLVFGASFVMPFKEWTIFEVNVFGFILTIAGIVLGFMLRRYVYTKTISNRIQKQFESIEKRC